MWQLGVFGVALEHLERARRNVQKRVEQRHARWHRMRAGRLPVVMLVRDGAAIPHADLAQSTGEIDWHSLELKVFCAQAEAAEGLVCLPEDGELHTLRVERSNNGFALEGDALRRRVAWRVLPCA